jgi:hypothetical protein
MRRINRLASLATLVLAGAAAPLHATLLTIAQPGAAYTSSTSLLPVTADELANVSSLTDGILTATFSEPLQVATVVNTDPTNWFNWGSPPAVENANPRVLISPGTTSTLLTITFSQPVTLFGLEGMPDGFGPEPMTENFFNGATNIGSISLIPDGSVGALLFAASSTIPITSINITTTADPLANGTDFAIGDLRYALAAPEPNTWIALVAGLGIIGWSRRRKLG